MTSGPSHVLVITKGDTGEGIIEEWRELLGPASVDEAREVKPDRCVCVCVCVCVYVCAYLSLDIVFVLLFVIHEF